MTKSIVTTLLICAGTHRLAWFFFMVTSRVADVAVAAGACCCKRAAASSFSCCIFCRLISAWRARSCLRGSGIGLLVRLRLVILWCLIGRLRGLLLHRLPDNPADDTAEEIADIAGVSGQ